MFCRKCGVHLKGNERFCPRCGAEIATGANDIWEQNAYINVDAPVAEEADASIKTSKSDKKPNLKNRKKKKKAKIVIPVLLIVVLAMCFVGVYGLHILDENKKAEETDIAQSSSTVNIDEKSENTQEMLTTNNDGQSKSNSMGNIDGQSKSTQTASVIGSDDEKSENTLSNPKWDSSGNVTYDCVWFGSYPQSDATGEKKDPIKWRVLSVNGNDAFLMADCNLDCQQYDTTNRNGAWEHSTIRSWLNGYNASNNSNGIDYSSDNFIDKAFTSTEQNAINQVTIANNDNPDYGTGGGNDTKDKVFLLSIEEVTNPDYGFLSDEREKDEARKRKNTVYATKIGGAAWWLRSSGRRMNYAAYVNCIGYVYAYGINVDTSYYVICPALHLNLSSDVWSYVGTVCTDGMVDETPIAKARADK